MQDLHHDTSKPMTPATATQPEQYTLRYLSHLRLLCTPEDAASGLLCRLARYLHQQLGGERQLVLSTECNTGTLVMEAPE